MSAGCLPRGCHQVTSEEFSRCYDDVNICLWTNGSQTTQSDAQAACQQRGKSSLVRVSDITVADKLLQFLSDVPKDNLLAKRRYWIDVTAAGDDDRHGFHWIDDSPLKSLYICLLSHTYIRWRWKNGTYIV